MILCYATKQALRDAQRLLPAGVCLENVVADAIANKATAIGREAGYVFLDEQQVVASVRRIPAIVREKPAWLIVGIRKHSRQHRGRRQGHVTALQ